MFYTFDEFLEDLEINRNDDSDIGIDADTAYGADFDLGSDDIDAVDYPMELDLAGSDISDTYLQEVDLDGDGIDDSIFQALDLDDDGFNESFEITSFGDSTGDGILDTVITETYMDTDGSGAIDTIVSEIGVDEDQSGSFDAIQIDVFTDTDDSGEFDDLSTMYFENIDDDDDFEYMFAGEDFDIDGEYDAVTQMQDFDDDGMFEEIVDPGETEYYDTFDPEQADPDMVIGDPVGDAENWHVQETSSTCGIASQEIVLEQLTGKEFDEGELADIAEANGWYMDEIGTPPEDMGNLLEYMGMDVERSVLNDVSDIENCLNNGGKVIVGVDSSELWLNENNDFVCGMSADHVVQVTGIDYTNPDSPMVILNDSGVANGAAATLPLEEFMEAWEDSGFYMIEAYNN